MPTTVITDTQLKSFKGSSITQGQTSVGSLKVVKLGRYVYTRLPWDATYDLVNGFDLNNEAYTPYDNNAVKFLDQKRLAIATADMDLRKASYLTAFQDSSDDNCPFYLYGYYIGGNHGLPCISVITVASHGKKTVDIGSEWLNASSVKFTIMRIVDANTLWMCSDIGATWGSTAVASNAVLTHNANATNTGTMTVTASTASTFLRPAYKNQIKRVFLNGVTEVYTDGVYSCDYVDILHTYDITDPPSLLAFVKAQVGSTTAPDFADRSIAIVGKVTIIYRVFENGAVVMLNTYMPTLTTTVSYIGFTQAGTMNTPASGSLWGYIPKVNSYVANSKTFDFKPTINWTSFGMISADNHEIDSTKWSDVNNPPDRFLQFRKDSGGVKDFGLCVGYNQKVGLGKPATRKTLITSAYQVYSTLKMYPKAIAGASTAYPSQSVPANTAFDCVAFRYPINYATNPNLTNFGWYMVDQDVYVNLDAHTNLTNYLYAVPVKFANYNIEVVEKSTDFTLNSAVVSATGNIDFSIANSYGTAVLRLYK